MQRVLKVADPARAVVLNYDQNGQRSNVQLVEPAKLAPLLAGKFTVPVPLDEFVRRFWGVFNLIALGQLDIKQYMTFTEGQINRSSEE